MLTRVLCVDDESAFLEIEKRYLEKVGEFEVDIATSVKDAVAIMDESSYDAIVSDYQMPGSDGIEFLKMLRNAGNEITFILMTGRGREDVAIDALNSGADFYLQKGLDPKSQFYELASMIRQAVRAKQAEKDIRVGEEWYRSLAESSMDFILVLGQGGVVEYANHFLLTAIGLGSDQVIGRKMSSVLPPTMASNITSRFSSVFSSGEPVALGPEEHDVRGTRLWLTTTLVPLKDEKGAVTSVMSISRDVSEIMRSSEAVARERDRVQNYLDSSSVLMVVVNADCVVELVNDSWSVLLGYEKDELVGRSLVETVVPEQSREELVRYFQGLVERRTPTRSKLEFPVVTKDGEVRLMHWNMSLQVDAEGAVEAAVCCGEDVTEVAVQDARFRLFAENAKDVVLRIILDPALRMEYISPSVLVLAGRAPEDFYLDPNLVFDVIHQDDRGKLRNLIESPESIGDSTVMRLFHADGSLKWVECTVTLVKGANGDVVALESVARDITERMRYENALRQVNKKLNLLSSITRHDVLNQLSVLVGWLQIATESEGSPDVLDCLQRCMDATSTIRTQLEFTEDYKRIGMKRPDWLDVDEVFKREVAGISVGGLEIATDVEGLEVFADTMLERVFYNLVANTISHAGDAHNVRLSHRFEGDDLMVVYEDDGKGIPQKEKEMVFERGYGKGTGYGLYLAREVLSITGSDIRETGVEGEGARFEISVPKGNYRFREP